MAKYNFQISYAPSRPRSSRRTATAASVTSVAAAPAVDISGKLDKAEFYKYFEEVNIGTAEAPVYATRSKRGLFSDSFVSALGLNPNTGGGGGGGATALSELSDVQLSGLLAGDVLIYDGTHWANRPQSSIVPDLSEYATRTWVQQQGYATTAALTAHAGDTALHVSASERTLWNRTATDFAAIVGADSDQIINKWEEVVAFLDTYTEADTLANLLSNKVDKTTRVVAGTGLTGGGALTGNVTLSLASRTLWGQSFNGEGNVSGDMTGVGSIDATGNITITRSPARFIAINGDATISLNNSTYKGIYYDTIAKWLIASDGTNTFLEIGNVAIGKKTAQYPLDVAGAIRLQNRLYFGDSTHYIELDENGDFHFSHGVYSDSFLSSLGLNSSGGGGTGGASYDRLDLWSDYTSERAGWVLSAGLGYELHNRVRSLEGGSALSFTDEGAGNVVTAVKKSGTSVTVTKGLTALTSHQPIYALNFQAGAFEAKKYTPNTGAQTVDIPTKTSHLSNDSGFITSAALTGYATQSWVKGLGYITASALTPYITAATANATFATKLGVSGNQIGTYVGGKLGNLITVPYATNADTVDGLHKSSLGQTFYNIALDANSYENLPYLYAGKLFNATNVPYTYYPFLHFGGGGFYAQFSAYGNALKFRASRESDYTPEWRTVAFTDSNVASATKLETARTIWGQSFDGTGNVSGDMTSVGAISATGNITIARSPARFIAINGDDTISLNNSSPYRGLYYDTLLKWIVASDGTNTFLEAGNIGVGTLSPTYKLDVNGDFRAKSIRIAGTANNQSSYISSSSSTNMLFYVNDKIMLTLDGSNMQVRPAGSTSNLMDFGGPSNRWKNVYANKVDASDTIHATTGIFSDGYMSAKGINTASDVRLKQRMEDVALTVRDVAEAPVYRFAWINGGGIDVGSTAQYWAARVPELTHVLQDGIHLGLDYGKAALLSVVAVARSTADHERRIASLERQLQNRTI